MSRLARIGDDDGSGVVGFPEDVEELGRIDPPAPPGQPGPAVDRLLPGDPLPIRRLGPARGTGRPGELGKQGIQNSPRLAGKDQVDVGDRRRVPSGSGDDPGDGPGWKRRPRIEADGQKTITPVESAPGRRNPVRTFAQPDVERVIRRKDVEAGESGGHRGIEGLGHLDAPGGVTPAARPQQQAGGCRLDQPGGRGRHRRWIEKSRRRVRKDISRGLGSGGPKTDSDRAGRMSRRGPTGRVDSSGQVVVRTDCRGGLHPRTVTLRRVGVVRGDHYQRNARRRSFGKGIRGRRERFGWKQDHARVPGQPGGGQCHEDRRLR